MFIAFALGATVLALSAGTVRADEAAALSEFYEIRQVSGNLFTRQHARLYVRVQGGRVEYLGSMQDPNWAQRSPFGFKGLVSKNIAVSADGRSVVYQHNAALAGRDSAKASGLYRHQVGGAETLLLTDAEFTIPAAQYPKPLPADVLAIGRAGLNVAVSADGAIQPLHLVGATALHRAAHDGDREAIARWARERKDGLDAQTYWGLAPLEIAILAAQEKAALDLLALGAEVRLTGEGNAPLFLASAYRRVEVVDELLRRRTPYDLADSYGITPFHALASFSVSTVLYPERVTDHDSFAATLDAYLRHGADISLRDGKGRTLLHLAPTSTVAPASKLRMVRHLIDKGSDIDAIDALGNTALHYAANMEVDERFADAWEERKAPIVRAIAEKSKSVDVKNARGITPLQRAAQTNSIRTAEYLIGRGADADVPFIHGGMGPKIPGQTIRDRIERVKKDSWWKESR